MLPIPTLRQTREVDDDYEEWDEQTLLDHGYEIMDDLQESSALAGLRDALNAAGSLFRLPDIALARASADLNAQINEALSPSRRQRRARNRKAEFANGDRGAEIVEDLAQVAAQVVVEFRGEYRYGGDYVAMACSDMMENATTTAEAIALLLANGYVADAYARWRGLHELACQAALMANATQPSDASKRYLVHGKRLLPDDPAYQEPWATPEFYDAHSEWLRDSYPNLSSKKQTPMKFTQKWIFDNAELKSAAFADWIKPSNDPVPHDQRSGGARQQPSRRRAGWVLTEGVGADRLVDGVFAERTRREPLQAEQCRGSSPRSSDCMGRQI